MKRQIYAALCALDLLAGPARAIVDGRTLGRLTSGAEAQMRARAVKLVTEYEDGTDEEFCSGYLRDDQTVVSAAHCFAEGANQYLDRGRVFAVSSDGSKRVQVELIGRRLDAHADISLLRLHGSFPIRDSARIAGQGCEPEAPVAIVGYGIDERENSGGTAKLAGYQIGLFGDYNVDLRARQGSVCDGDSGGPAYCKSHGQWVFAGVVRDITYYKRSLKRNAPVSPICRSASEADITPASAIVDLQSQIPTATPGPDRVSP